MNQLIELSLAQRFLVSLFVLILMVIGVQALRDIPIDAFPDVTTPQVKIIIKAAGMTPSEIETRITSVVENELLGIAHKKP